MRTRAATQIEPSLRNSDTVYRFGGEEFAILLPHTNDEATTDVADRVRQAVADIRVKSEYATITVCASYGMTELMNGEDFTLWLARADEALYRAKDHGRNCTLLAK